MGEFYEIMSYWQPLRQISSKEITYVTSEANTNIFDRWLENDGTTIFNNEKYTNKLSVNDTFDDLIAKMTSLQFELNDPTLNEASLISTGNSSDSLKCKFSPNCVCCKEKFETQDELNNCFIHSRNDSLEKLKKYNKDKQSSFSRGSLSEGDLTSYELYDCFEIYGDNDNVPGESNESSIGITLDLSRANVFSKQEFIGKSFSVDIINEDEGYVSNSRRNGVDFEFNSNEDDFSTDFIQFNKYYKKRAFAKNIAKSVKTFITKDKATGGRYRSLTDPINPSTLQNHTNAKFFKKSIFHAKSGSNEYSNDSTEYFHNSGKLFYDNHKLKNRRVSIALVKDTVKKISGIKEIYIDENGNVIKKLEIKKMPGQSLGFYIRSGNGIDRIHEGIFVSRVTLGSFADVNSLLYAGDEILSVNQHETNGLSLEEVISMIQDSNDLYIETKSAKFLSTFLKTSFHKTDLKTLKDIHSPPILNETHPKSCGIQTISKQCGKNKNTFSQSKQNNMSLAKPETGKKTHNKKAADTDLNNDIRIYESEKLSAYESDKDIHTSADIKKIKTFSGSLYVTMHEISGCREQGCFVCAIEINGEAKANASGKKMQEHLKMDESFEIEVNEASLMELKLFLNKKDKPIDIARLYLGKPLAYENPANLILKTVNFGIKIRLSLEYVGNHSFLKRAPSKFSNGVFGFNIAQTLIEDANTIPLIVRKCVHEIEVNGISQEGIYRICGNAKKKKILRAKFDDKTLENDNTDDFDCHVMSGVLKDYLRELPQPLIPQKLFLKLYEHSLLVENNCSPDIILLDAMKNVHYSNRATLIYIMEHLLKIASRKEENKMDFKNLAVCFGPVMMCPPALTSGMLDIKKQVDALEYLLKIWPQSLSQNQV